MYLLYKKTESLILLSHRVQCDTCPQNFHKCLNIPIYICVYPILLQKWDTLNP